MSARLARMDLCVCLISGGPTAGRLIIQGGEDNNGTLGIIHHVFSYRRIYLWWWLCNAPDHTKRDCRKKEMVYK
jgi:hypothetical protein